MLKVPLGWAVIKGTAMAASDTPWATRGDQTWSEIWQRLQQKESNWQCAGDGREMMGPRSQKGGTAVSPPMVTGHQLHRQSAVPMLGCLFVCHEGYQGWGATPLPGPSLWQRSKEWPQDPHPQRVRPENLAELPSTNPGLIRSYLTSR